MGKKKTPSRTVGDTPTPPITKRSLNLAIIDDNIAKLEKAIKAGDVTANPAGTSEETLLTSIGIDGKKYDIGASAENVSYDNTDSGLTADDVQGAIDEVSSDIDGVITIVNNLQFAVVTGTLSDSNGYSTNVPLPSGFTVSDTIIAGFQIETSSNHWRTVGEGSSASSYARTFLELGNDAVSVYNDSSAALGKPFKALLYKVIS